MTTQLKTRPELTDALRGQLINARCRKQATDYLIKMINDSRINPLAMLTVSPWRELDRNQIENLAGGLRDCVIQRLDPNRRIPIFAPLLTMYEKNEDNNGYHIHLILPWLPLDRLIKGTQKVSVKETISAAGKKVGAKYTKAFKWCGYEWTKEFQLEVYQYCFKNPIQLDKWKDKNRRAFKAYCPTSRDGLTYSPVDQEQQFEGYSGWEGLVNYCTKSISEDRRNTSNIDEDNLVKLQHFNDNIRINSDTPTATLEGFFQ